MRTVTLDSGALREAFVNDLANRGYLPDPRWRAAFRLVAREAFLGRFTLPARGGKLQHHDLDDPADADAALAAVYTDNSLLTQFDFGGTATSSSTAPSLMALMLHQLDVQAGQRVLEIGTGTGYNAALLSEVLGEQAVTTMDIDPDLCRQAQAALAVAGYAPAVACGDGGDGAPERGPYDRIIATCGFSRVPPAWLTQVRPGGRILVNLSSALAVLTVLPDGSAEGSFTDRAFFMARREDPANIRINHRDVLAYASGNGAERHVSYPVGLDDPAVMFLRGLMMPSVQQVIVDPKRTPTYKLLDADTGSWARATPTHDTGAIVVTHGPRDLWAELAKVVDIWTTMGSPAPTDFRLQVTADGQHLLHYESSKTRLH
jgi:protein-L-isoaspartate O-methyltransferase